MGFVIDFYHNTDNEYYKGYILRLRANNNTLIDLAGNTWETNGVQYSTGKFGGQCFGLNGSNSNYIRTYLNRTILENEDFTISFFVKYNSNPCTTRQAAISNVNPYPATWEVYHPDITLSYPNMSEFPFNNICGNMHGSQSSEISNTWIHFAYTRYNNIIRCFRNGSLYNNSNTKNCKLFDSSIYTWIGKDQRNNGTINGYFDDMCIYCGKALWTSNFTPPSDYLPDKL